MKGDVLFIKALPGQEGLPRITLDFPTESGKLNF